MIKISPRGSTAVAEGDLRSFPNKTALRFFKAIPHNSKRHMTVESFSSECLKTAQAGWRPASRL